MSIKLTIMDQMEQIAREHGKTLAPLSDDLVLLDSGLNSLGFAVLVARLEDRSASIRSPPPKTPCSRDLRRLREGLRKWRAEAPSLRDCLATQAPEHFFWIARRGLRRSPARAERASAAGSPSLRGRSVLLATRASSPPRWP